MQELWEEFQKDKAQSHFLDNRNDLIWNLTARARKELVCTLQYQAFVWLYNKYKLNSHELKQQFKQYQKTQITEKSDSWDSKPSELRNITIKYQKQAFNWLTNKTKGAV